MNYFTDDIVIVGYGCVLPDAPNPDTFWKNLSQGRNSIQPIAESRFCQRFFVSEDPNEMDRTISNYAGVISDALIDSLRVTHGKDRTRLELMSIEAARQALNEITLDAQLASNAAIVLGCMGQDESVSLLRLLEEESSLRTFAGQNFDSELSDFFQKIHDRIPMDAKSATFATSATNSVREKFGFGGEAFLVDAACGSSLAAIDIAAKMLREKETELVLSGGIEAQLAPENFVLFSQTGLHAKTHGKPLDDSSQGINQGEGAVVFALMRYEDALKRALPIRGVLVGLGASSNGIGASLFSPTVEGQRLALKKAYQRVNPNDAAFFEFHATGTKVGDAAELEATSGILEPTGQNIPIGSVKGLIGHAKGAAGAAGLLKTLLALGHDEFPGTPYFQHFTGNRAVSRLFVNKTNLRIDSTGTFAGVSSAGFGGANFHCVVAKPPASKHIEKRLPFSRVSVGVFARASLSHPRVRAIFSQFDFKIPPKNLPFIDDSQLYALILAKNLVEKSGIKWETVDLDRVSVISASTLGLRAHSELSKRVRHFELLSLTEKGVPHDEVQRLIQHKEHLTGVSEETGPGTLNNVIAGRVAQQFNFRGKNLNIDCDLASAGAALRVARRELQSGESDWVFFFAARQEWKPGQADVQLTGMDSLLLGSESSGKKFIVDPLEVIEEVALESA